MKVLEAIGDTMSEEDREKAVRAVSDSLIEGVNAETGLTSYVRSAYQGNAYYLYVTEVFRDIRLVGTPPESIGNFGKVRPTIGYGRGIPVISLSFASWTLVRIISPLLLLPIMFRI